MAWDLSNVIINLKAKISEISAQIPGLATTSKAGIVKPDGSTITIADGVISAAGPESVTITKTSGETWRSILTRLYNAMDTTKLSGSTYIDCWGVGRHDCARLQTRTSSTYRFAMLMITDSSDSETDYYGTSIVLSSSSSSYMAIKIQGTTKTDLIDTEYGSDSITLYY